MSADDSSNSTMKTLSEGDLSSTKVKKVKCVEDEQVIELLHGQASVNQEEQVIVLTLLFQLYV